MEVIIAFLLALLGWGNPAKPAAATLQPTITPPAPVVLRQTEHHGNYHADPIIVIDDLQLKPRKGS